MRPYASLRRRADFARLRNRGRRISAGPLTFYRAESFSGDATSLVGITVSTTVGKAVVRNKLRRRLAALLDEALAGQRMRLLVVARPGAGDAPFALLRRSVERALA